MLGADRTTETGASAISLFIKIHESLYKKSSLQSLDELRARFLEKLAHTKALISPSKAHSDLEEFVSKQKYSQTFNIMTAVVNISAVMQFGSEDSLLTRTIANGRDKSGKSQRLGSAENCEQQMAFLASNQPQAAQQPADKSSQLSNLIHGEQSPSLSMADLILSESTSENVPNEPPSYVYQVDDYGVPIELQKALKLTFSMLTYHIDNIWTAHDREAAITPSVTTILTFVAFISQVPAALAVIEDYIPYSNLTRLFNAMPPAARSNLNNPSTRLFGTPLPEDWCIRGMAWTGRQLFGRGYWKSKFVTGAVYQSDESKAYLIPEGEADVLAEVYEGSSMPPHAGGPAELNDALSGTSEVTSQRETLGMLRWKRVALMAAWLIRAGVGLYLNEETGSVEIGSDLGNKMKGWQGEDAAQGFPGSNVMPTDLGEINPAKNFPNG